MNFENRLGMH